MLIADAHAETERSSRYLVQPETPARRDRGHEKTRTWPS